MSRYANHRIEDALAYNLSAENVQLETNFRLREFACNDDSSAVLVHPRLCGLVQRVRDRFGASIRINSGYRTGAHNKIIGGSRNSRHLYGMAADIVVTGVPPSEVADYADEIGVGGVGRYEDFTHVDVYGQNRRW